ncbi:MAG: hypothetical protein QNK04_09030 [Myxococcota bacterium]|nr:hypothetical protein [Myxococcota bacterium]
MSHLLRRTRCLALLAGAALLHAPGEASPEWRIDFENNFYYTDDAALFSSTRRTAKDQDPTQPVLDFDLAEQGSDFVYEPALELKKTFSVRGRGGAMRVRTQGFVFARNPEYNHPSLAVEVALDPSEKARIYTRYFFISDLFLGDNEVRFPEGEEEEPELFAEEVLDTHFWAVGLRYALHERVAATAFGRVGIRRYDEPFRQRDTNFYAGGLHLHFELGERVDLTLGFHYERGLADGRNGSERALRDDISYHNYFLTSEIEVELMPRLGLELALHYERNDWTTNIRGDERNGEHEDQFQGDIAFLYDLTEIFDLAVGFQGVHRKESFEDGLRNINAWLGVRATF